MASPSRQEDLKALEEIVSRLRSAGLPKYKVSRYQTLLKKAMREIDGGIDDESTWAGDALGQALDSEFEDEGGGAGAGNTTSSGAEDESGVTAQDLKDKYDDLKDNYRRAKEKYKKWRDKKVKRDVKAESTASPKAGGARAGGTSAAETKAAQQAAKETAKTAAKTSAAAETEAVAGAGAARAGGGLLGRLVALLGGTTFWVVLGIVLLVIIIVVVIAGLLVSFSSKQIGGSAVSYVLDYEDEYDRGLVEEVIDWTIYPEVEPRLVVEDGARSDLEWQEETDDEGNVTRTHLLDRRVLETLRYLLNNPAKPYHLRPGGSSIPGRGWDKIGVSILRSNGPQYTARMSMYDTSESSTLKNDVLKTVASYYTGQALAINKIGMTSSALTQAWCPKRDPVTGACIPVPLEVGWQLTTAEDLTRPIYEQLQWDATDLMDRVEKISNQLELVEADSDQWDKIIETLEAKIEAGETPVQIGALELLRDNVLENLRRLMQGGTTTLVSGESLDARTFVYAGLGFGSLELAKIRLEGALENSVEDFMLEWKDPFTKTTVNKGLEFVFRAMKVANMVGWKGNPLFGFKFWKAYEIRQNIRQLEVDLLRMPNELAAHDPWYLAVIKDVGQFFIDKITGPLIRSPQITDDDFYFEATYAPKQIIVYSPEDDLDNNIVGLDVFPRGIVSVSEGGAGYDNSKQDGKYDYRDKHFAYLPADGGALSKPCTAFIYPEALAGLATDLASGLAPEGAAADICNILYGIDQVVADVEADNSGDEEGSEESDVVGESGEPVVDTEEDVEEDTEEDVVNLPQAVSYREFVHVGF